VGGLAYPVPIYLPRRRRIVTPGEWLRDKLEERRREREATIVRAIEFDGSIATPVTDTASIVTNAVAAAGRVWMAVVWNDPTATLTGGSGGGLTWVVDRQDVWAAIDSNLGFLSADAPSGLGSGVTLTPQFSDAVDFGPGICAFSFTGVEVGDTGYLDGTPPADKEDFSTSWTTNDIVTTNDDDLIFGLSSSDAASHTPIANYPEVVGDFLSEGSTRMVVVYRIVTAAGTYNPGGTWGGLSFQHNIGLAYKAATGEAPPAVNPIVPDFARGAFPMIPVHKNPWMPR